MIPEAQSSPKRKACYELPTEYSLLKVKPTSLHNLFQKNYD